MNNLQSLTDKTAIGLSAMCAIHCMLLPMAVLLLPSVALLPLDEETFHQAMLVMVVPTSLIALTMGCRKHKRYRVYIAGATGLALLGVTGYLGHDTLGEWGEKLLTVASATMIAFSHLRNYQLCRQPHCHSDDH